MRKVLLDTDILSEVFKHVDPVVTSHAIDYLRFHRALSFTSVSLVEILSGLIAKDAKNQIAKMQSFLGHHEQIVPDDRDYLLAAHIIGHLRNAGRPIGWADPVIASCAINRDMPIATANIKHYQQIADIGYDLTLVNWRER